MWWQLVIDYIIPLHLVRTMSQGTPPPTLGGVVVGTSLRTWRPTWQTRRPPPSSTVSTTTTARKQGGLKTFHPPSASFVPRSERLKMGTVFTYQHSINQFPHCEAACDPRNIATETTQSTPNETATVMLAVLKPS